MLANLVGQVNACVGKCHLIFSKRVYLNGYIGQSPHFLKSREFQLTYEDKDGDWMLVGDVPWE